MISNSILYDTGRRGTFDLLGDLLWLSSTNWGCCTLDDPTDHFRFLGRGLEDGIMASDRLIDLSCDVLAIC